VSDLDATLNRGHGARVSDPPQSHAAVPRKVGPIALAVLLQLLDGPATDEALIDAIRPRMHCSESSPRKRRGELVKNGYVHQVGLAQSEFGNDVALWGLTMKGVQRATQIPR